MDVYKVHISFEAVYFIKSRSLAEARERLKSEKIGDNVHQRNVSLLHICTDAELEALKEKGTLILEDDGEEPNVGTDKD